MADDRGLRLAKSQIRSCMTCPFRRPVQEMVCAVGGRLGYGDGHQIPPNCPLRDGEIVVRLAKDHR